MKDLDKIRDATCGETKAAIETATQAATYVATCGETKAATWAAVYNATNAATSTATRAATWSATSTATYAATCNIIYESSTTTMVAIEESVLDIMENINEN